MPTRLLPIDRVMPGLQNSRRNFVELMPEKFATYLQAEGMENILRQRKENGEDDQPASERLSACHVLRLCHLKGMGSDGRYHGTMEQCMIADDVERSWRKGKKYNRIDSRASVPMNFRGLVQEGSRAL